MIIGIDFDNTIVNYEKVFYDVALKRKLIPTILGKTKKDVKEFLHSTGKEKVWTELQGIVYGPEIIRAEPYPHILEFLRWCKHNKIKTCIISHKTQYPFIGEKHDLHTWGKHWLKENGFFSSENGLSLENIFFCPTMEEKIMYIKEQKCTHFIDDLPEIFLHNSFPPNITAILFDKDKTEKTWQKERIVSWKEFQQIIESEIKISSFINEPLQKIQKLDGGRNNQSFQVLTKTGKKVFCKAYFTDFSDKRNRLNSEFSFLNFLWEKGIRMIPQPLKYDDNISFGLYSYVEGSKIKNVAPEHIQQAIDFYQTINKYKLDANHLPLSSEACFSITDHLSCVEKRIQRVQSIERSEIKKFIDEMIIPKWKNLLTEIKLHKTQIELDKILPRLEHCLSPSDFGFHNAIIDADGKITFIDFEYAGWDDPAKLVCDFFCQPQIPIPKEYFSTFSKSICGEDQKCLTRVKELMPFYKIKWCCIMLNEFLPQEAKRRAFSFRDDKEENQEQLKIEQLEKVKRYFAAMF